MRAVARSLRPRMATISGGMGALMGDQGGGSLSWAWTQQRIWSLTANRLKRRIDGARLVALCLAVATAALAVTAVQVADFASWAGRSLSAAAAIAAGLGTMAQRRASTDQVRQWTRARSAAEGLKSEVYEYLAGGSTYTGGDRDSLLRERARGIVDDMSDLARLSLGVTSDGKPAPTVHDRDSYITERLDAQVNDYYRPRAVLYEQRVRRLRAIGDVLGVIAIVLAAAAAAFAVKGIAAWVPVVTTVGTSVVAYLAAARYDHLIVEFLRTAQRLEDLRDTRADNPAGDAALIDAAEAAISVENQGWMARWHTPDPHD